MLEKSLPSEYYRSAEIFAKERERIFSREWVCAGRADELPPAGEVRVLDVFGESLLIARTKEGRLGAHYNVCRHRGARLCSGGGGRRKLAVPRAARGRVDPLPVPLLDLRSRRQAARRTVSEPGPGASARGLFAPPGLDRALGRLLLPEPLAGRTARAGLRRRSSGRCPSASRATRSTSLRTARRLVYEVQANWKVIAENYNECYHCAGVHPELCEVVPAFREKGGAGLDWDHGVPHRDGAFTFTRSGTTDRAPFPGLSDDEKVRHKGELVYPNLFLSLSSDHVTAFRLLPEAPDRTRIVCDFLFDPAEMARPGFDPSDAVDFWDLINRQDWAICEEVQRGLASRVHAFGYYAPMEDMSLDIRRYVLERLEDR